ncbi:uncharacterized protein LY89DRAFT_674488 [Mollisia scopiformis]|uniref:Apple domain-containing protein n=1 Tax=Mollisia scopiformis TaxID=149040 RepID=A0A194WTY1_MOLSC|nr:uncharacterized protein LY89DRAFT_674488 [Mollisia scopiformis]KUJ11144.1 hypothetical protein LY89DRAFT_674488 [Mollisia scopiformis]
MLLLTITGLASLAFIAKASPFENQARAACNADNCLRELRGTSSLASPYCSSYYTSTTTVTTTTTVPALDATFPGVKKREPTVAPDFEKRATTLPPFATSCTQTATALSSGCSCLLGSAAATTTSTITSTSTLPLPVQCSSQNSYGLYPTPLSIVSIPGGNGASGLAFEVYPGGCCAYCFASPNCIAYYEEVDYVASVPGKVACGVQITGSQPIEPLGVDSCPLGTVTLSAGPVETTVLWGVGNCGVVEG